MSARITDSHLENLEERMRQYISKYLCPRCKTEIRDVYVQGPHPITKEKYCINCKLKLWTVCDCGGHLSLDMRVCNKCGNHNMNYLCDENNIKTWISGEI